MSDHPAPRLVVELVRAIALLALPETDQKEYLHREGLAPLLDELALRLGDLAPLAPQFLAAGWLSEDEVQALAEIVRLLDEMSLGDESLWKEAALAQQEWIEVRRLSAHFFIRPT